MRTEFSQKYNVNKNKMKIYPTRVLLFFRKKKRRVALLMFYKLRMRLGLNFITFHAKPKA